MHLLKKFWLYNNLPCERKNQKKKIIRKIENFVKPQTRVLSSYGTTNTRTDKNNIFWDEYLKIIIMQFHLK